MKVFMYSKSNCPKCLSAKMWMKERGVTYEEVSLDDNDNKEKFLAEFPSVRSVPQIVVEKEDGDRILVGGYAELTKTDIFG